MTDRVDDNPILGGDTQVLASEAGVTPAVAEGDEPKVETVDVEKLQSDLEEARTQISGYEDNISQMRSSYDKRNTQEVQEARDAASVAEDRMHQVAMSTMDENERVKYELDVERERNRKLAEENQATRQMADANASMNNYAQAFMKMGVPYESLDFSSPEALYASGWEGSIREREELQAKLDAALASPQPADQTQQPLQSSTTPAAPPLLQGQGQTPSGTKSIQDVVTALKGQYPDIMWNEDVVMTYVERGKLPISILEGVDFTR